MRDTPAVSEARERLEKLALDYHKSPEGEGEYGCPGLTCPGVQRLIKFAEAVVRSEADPLTAWQPIATAPKDGRPILVHDEGCVLIASWVDEEQVWWDNGAMHPPPQHWQPLPSPPDAAYLASRSAGESNG